MTTTHTWRDITIRETLQEFQRMPIFSNHAKSTKYRNLKNKNWISTLYFELIGLFSDIFLVIFSSWCREGSFIKEKHCVKFDLELDFGLELWTWIVTKILPQNAKHKTFILFISNWTWTIKHLKLYNEWNNILLLFFFLVFCQTHQELRHEV